MSNWKVFKTNIQLFTHPNADSLEIGKVGSYQIVVQKGLYKSGDEVIFVPEKSIVSGDIKAEFQKYLVGPDFNRIKAVRLRGEISSGIIIPKHLAPNFDQYEIEEDISSDLGITKYEPPIPLCLNGKVKSFDIPFIGQHDCEHANVYVNDLIDGERVVITEKIHGSQIIFAYDFSTGSKLVSSKGFLKNGLTIEEEDSNFYWKAIKNDKILEIVQSSFSEGVIQIFGELIPIQKGYSYGQLDPTIRIFDIRINGKSIPYDIVPDKFKSMWATIIYDGPLSLIHKEVVLYEDKSKGIRNTRIDKIISPEVTNLCQGMEQVSGKEIHIREGIVIRPYVDRNAFDGTKLRLKIINPKYKESGEEIN